MASNVPMNERDIAFFPMQSIKIGEDDDGNPIYNNAADAEILQNMRKREFTDGVYTDDSTYLQVMSNNNMTITVKAGYSHIFGIQVWVRRDITLTVEPSEISVDRTDRVVLRASIPDMDVTIYIKKGSTELERIPGQVWELGLADLFVAKMNDVISQSEISDLRGFPEICGFVACNVTVDTATIFNQYAAWLAVIQASWATWSEAEKEAWYAWWADQHDTSGYVTANNIYTYFTPIVQQIGNGADKEFTITHNFAGMRYPDVKMVVTTTGEEVIPDNTFLSETTVRVSFDEYTPAENEFTVIVRR